MASLARMSCWGWLISVRWRKVPAGPANVPMWMRLSSRRSSGQVAPHVFSAMRARRRASQHRMTWARMRSSLRAQVNDLLHVPPAALDLEQLLVAERDVLGGHLRVGGAQQVLAVEVLLGLGPGRVDAEEAAGGGPQVPVQAGLG